jgi:hypothetical protein
LLKNFNQDAVRLCRSAILRVFAAVAVAILFVAVAPLVVSAAPAFTNVSLDRTTVTQGQSISVFVTTTPQTTFVFATVDGVRTQGTRIMPDTGNQRNWQVTIAPTQTSMINVFANNANNENGAAVLGIPITVTVPTPPQPPTPPITTPPTGTIGPIEIVSVTETPAVGEGMIQLTVVTGPEAQYAWVRFDENRFARGTITSQTTTHRTWVINFRPFQWTAQQVLVASNRVYNWTGASRQYYNLTLAHPFVQPVVPVINTVTVNPANRTVNPGSSATLTIRTNADVNAVWVRDVDGREHNARAIAPTTATARTWEVTFNPIRTGAVLVFANTSRVPEGAATRTESLIVVAASASIVAANAQWMGGAANELRVQATTNSATQTVWAVLSNGNRIQLTRTDTGTGDRTWQAWLTNVPAGNIVIHASRHTGNINALSADDTRTVTWDGGQQGAGGWIQRVTPLNTHVSPGTELTLEVDTHVDVTSAHLLRLTPTHLVSEFVFIETGVSGNTRRWRVHIRLANTIPQGTSIVFAVQAVDHNGQHRGTLNAGPVWII